MDRFLILIRNKPKIYLFVSLFYLLVVMLIKWLFQPHIDAVWFLMGGLLGIYFLDAAELFFALTPSPFRSVLFFSLFIVVAFFVVTSSTGTIGSGLVLTLYLQFLLWQVGEWRISGNLTSWYRTLTVPVEPPMQRLILVAAFIVFVVETIIFVRIP